MRRIEPSETWLRYTLRAAALFAVLALVKELLAAEGRSDDEWPGVAMQILATLLLVIGLEARALRPRIALAKDWSLLDRIIGTIIGIATLWAFNNCMYVAIRGQGLAEVGRANVTGALTALMVVVVGLAIAPRFDGFPGPRDSSGDDRTSDQP